MFLDPKNLQMTQTDFSKNNRLTKQLKVEGVLFEDFQRVNSDGLREALSKAKLLNIDSG